VRPDSLAIRAGSFHPGIAAQIRTADALKRELADLGAEAGALMMHAQTEWQSATFSGVRHRLAYVFDGDDAVAQGLALLDRLPDHRFTIPHQLVADATVTEVDHRLAEPQRLEVTLELMLLDKS